MGKVFFNKKIIFNIFITFKYKCVKAFYFIKELHID